MNFTVCYRFVFDTYLYSVSIGRLFHLQITVLLREDVFLRRNGYSPIRQSGQFFRY